MGSFSFRLGAVALAIALYGCSGQLTAQPAKLPPRVVEPRTEVAPAREDTPKLIAPPPAYGHKIVMAKGPYSGTAE
jgi:hypothetical protein